MISAINCSQQSRPKFHAIKRNNLQTPQKTRDNVSFGIVPYSFEFYGLVGAAALALSTVAIFAIFYLANLCKK